MRVKKHVPYLLIAPFFFIYIAFTFYPTMFSLAMSFTKWNAIGVNSFVGLDNYIRLVQDKVFWKAVLNTLLFMVFTIPINNMIGMLLAVLLKDFTKRSRSAFQLIYFLPYITAPVAMGMLFSILFDYNNGTVNMILSSLGVIDKPVFWLGVKNPSRFVLILLMSWRNYGYSMVMYLAGLSTIPDELYEVAMIDGASWKQRFTNITIPLLKPVIQFMLVTGLINGWKIFDEVKLLFNGEGIPHTGPENSAITVVMHFYNTSFNRYDMGYGAAVGYGMFLLILAAALFSLKITREGSE